MTKVQLLKRHTHAGAEREAGSVLELDDDSARWLIEVGVARAMTLRTAALPDNLKEKSK